jgi:hypothetical protein
MDMSIERPKLRRDMGAVAGASPAVLRLALATSVSRGEARQIVGGMRALQAHAVAP